MEGFDHSHEKKVGPSNEAGVVTNERLEILPM
jgi:hypothetical protein